MEKLRVSFVGQIKNRHHRLAARERRDDILRMKDFQLVFPHAPGKSEWNPQQARGWTNGLEAESAVWLALLYRCRIGVIEDELVVTGNRGKAAHQLAIVGFVAALVTADTMNVDSNTQTGTHEIVPFRKWQS